MQVFSLLTWCPETKGQAFDGGGKHHIPEGKKDEYKKAWCKKPVPAICLPFLYTKTFIRTH